MDIKQNTLYLTTPNSYISRDHLTLRIEVDRELKLAVPIHHLESVCIFGPSLVSPSALELCWEHGVAVNYFSENGYFIGRWEGVANTSVMLRRTQYRAADDPKAAASIARQCVAGKLQNSRQSLLRSARETESAEEEKELRSAAAEIARVMRRLQELPLIGVVRPDGCLAGSGNPIATALSTDNAVGAAPNTGVDVVEFDGGSGVEVTRAASDVDRIRGFEGQGANLYFKVFSFHLR